MSTQLPAGSRCDDWEFWWAPALAVQGRGWVGEGQKPCPGRGGGEGGGGTGGYQWLCAAQLCEHGSLQAASELAKPGEDVISSQVGGEGQSEKTKASRPMGVQGGRQGEEASWLATWSCLREANSDKTWMDPRGSGEQAFQRNSTHRNRKQDTS